MLKDGYMLQTIGWILRIEAWATAILGIAGSVVLAWLVGTGLSFGAGGGFLSGGVGALVIFLIGSSLSLWFALPMLILAELVFMLMRIERKTLEMAELIRQKQQ
jgi:hypothetical protein